MRYERAHLHRANCQTPALQPLMLTDTHRACNSRVIGPAIAGPVGPAPMPLLNNHLRKEQTFRDTEKLSQKVPTVLNVHTI